MKKHFSLLLICMLIILGVACLTACDKGGYTPVTYSGSDGSTEYSITFDSASTFKATILNAPQSYYTKQYYVSGAYTRVKKGLSISVQNAEITETYFGKQTAKYVGDYSEFGNEPILGLDVTEDVMFIDNRFVNRSFLVSKVGSVSTDKAVGLINVANPYSDSFDAEVDPDASAADIASLFKLTLLYDTLHTSTVTVTPDMLASVDTSTKGIKSVDITVDHLTYTAKIRVGKLPSITLGANFPVYVAQNTTLADFTLNNDARFYYDNNTSAPIRLGTNMVTGFDSSKIGSNTITISYQNSTTTAVLVVYDSTAVKRTGIASLNLTSNFVKKGAACPISQITIRSSDGALEKLTTGFEVSGFSSNNIGITTATVTCGDLSARTAFYVYDNSNKTVESISVYNSDAKTDVAKVVNGVLDLSGFNVYYQMTGDTSTSASVALTEDMLVNFDAAHVTDNVSYYTIKFVANDVNAYTYYTTLKVVKA